MPPFQYNPVLTGQVPRLVYCNQGNGEEGEAILCLKDSGKGGKNSGKEAKEAEVIVIRGARRE